MVRGSSIRDSSPPRRALARPETLTEVHQVLALLPDSVSAAPEATIKDGLLVGGVGLS
jgi:hypothetical protein